MALAAVDPGKLLALMIFGGLFALAGLWLMFKPKAEGGAAKIELFGLKFESSSAGLLVFLIGAAFLALPLFTSVTEHADPGTAPRPRAETDAQAAPLPPPSGTTFAGKMGDIPLPRRADGTEVEDNNTVQDSNQIEIGQTYKGALSPGDEDWFVFRTDTSSGEKIRVTFRNLGGGCPQYYIYDAVENQINYEQECDRSLTKTYWIQSDFYFLRVIANNYRTTYEIFLDYVK